MEDNEEGSGQCRGGLKTLSEEVIEIEACGEDAWMFHREHFVSAVTLALMVVVPVKPLEPQLELGGEEEDDEEQKEKKK